MPTIFTRMLEGTETARFLYRDDRLAVVTSNTPVKPGHCIVFPLQEIASWLDLPPDLSSRLFAQCQRVGRAIERVYKPRRIGLSLIGIVVPHVHIHLVPINAVAEMDFTKQDLNALPADLDEAARLVGAALAQEP